MEYTQTYESPLGTLLLSSDGEALTGLWFTTEQRFLAYTLEGGQDAITAATRAAGATGPAAVTSAAGVASAGPACADLPVFAQTRAWLDAYFGNPGVDPGPIPPVNPQVTPFRREVCAIMARIPYGQSVTYGQIAQELADRHGKRMSAQAVGGAVGHNPIGIIIPCHRVVGAGGNLTGYGGGMKRKVALLELEGFDMSRFTVPTKGTAL
ncbi:MAG: methylated-DNA--[protein]-cysteine S-methyltransferase [Coriobacteriia bacterium]|nr:methylated-DNA--[protein]-cysteine S-methyltransferase [Coriobacteriia bacterium]